jgi:hypothetical protein
LLVALLLTMMMMMMMTMLMVALLLLKMLRMLSRRPRLSVWTHLLGAATGPSAEGRRP